jgi:hypothetical protein
VGEGCNCRYIRYALIEPVLENKFQKNSEVRMFGGDASPVVQLRAGLVRVGEVTIAPLRMRAKS